MKTAVLINMWGDRQTIMAENGRYILELPGALCTQTIGDYCMIGGTVYYLVQDVDDEDDLLPTQTAVPTFTLTPLPPTASPTPTATLTTFAHSDEYANGRTNDNTCCHRYAYEYPDDCAGNGRAPENSHPVTNHHTTGIIPPYYFLDYRNRASARAWIGGMVVGKRPFLPLNHTHLQNLNQTLTKNST